VSVSGVTGPRTNVNPRVESLIKEVKQVHIMQKRRRRNTMTFLIVLSLFADSGLSISIVPSITKHITIYVLAGY
jgi:hypothetical protein